MTMLEVRDLTVTYRTGSDEVPAVRGLNLDLDRGETLGVAGESGSGKSTLALSLLRLLPATTRVTGEIRFEGEDLLAATWGTLRAVRWSGASVVFQGAMSALNPVQTIGEQIREPILLHEKVADKEARRRADALLDSVGVPARRAGAYPHELSGGQRQRVMIAMALACRPNLVIADEPTTALDVMVQAQILHLLGDLVREQGIGMIMISHDLSVLADTCQRLAVMYAGRIVEIGASASMLAEARHPYTAALSAAFPQIGDPASRRAPRGLPGDPPDLRLVGTGCSFADRCASVMPVCRERDPLLAPAGAGREAACFLVSDVAVPDAGVPDASAPDAGVPGASAPGGPAPAAMTGGVR